MNMVSWTKQIGLGTLLAACMLTSAPKQAAAQIGWTPAGEVCTSERTVSGVVVERKTCVRWKPVTQVCMKPEQTVTYRNVCRVGFRNEQFLQLVPKTTYQTVTVDEGCWKMVWCPKPVTKVVPRTTMTQQVRTRRVPYQYMDQVPQTITRMVPKYTTKYVPETYQTVERKPFHHRLPGQQTVMRPPSCAAPTPGCAAPAPVPRTSYAPPAAAPPGCAVPQETAYTPSPAPAAPGPAPAPAAPGCAVPQQVGYNPPAAPPGCAVPSVYPPANTPQTYETNHANIYENGVAPAPYEPAVPPESAPLHGHPADHAHPPEHSHPHEAVPEPTGAAHSYYPTRPAPPARNWSAREPEKESDLKRAVKSLASLWQD